MNRNSRGTDGRGFKRSGVLPGFSKRGVFIAYNGGARETLWSTLLRMWKKLALALAMIATGALVIYMLEIGGKTNSLIVEKQTNRSAKVEAFRAPQVVYDFLDAETVEERLAHVRDAESVADSMREYYVARPSVRESYRAVQPAESRHLADTISVERFYVELEDRLGVVAVVETEDGHKIDWPAFAQANPVSLNSFVRGGASSRLDFRVLISDFEYYASEFADDTRFQSYRVTSPDLEIPATVYAEKGTELERELSHYAGPAEQRCILTLARPEPENNGGNRLRVNALVARGWVLP